MFSAYIDIFDIPLPPAPSCYLNDKLKIYFKLRYKFIYSNHKAIVATANLLFLNVEKFPLRYLNNVRKTAPCLPSTIVSPFSSVCLAIVRATEYRMDQGR